MGSKVLSLSNLDASYGKKQVLFDATFSINKGDKVLLIGPNGAGKSTILKAITGLLPLSHGKISFLDRDISGWSTHKRIHSGIGYLLQSQNIVPSLSVEENLMISGYTTRNDHLQSRLETLLDQFNVLREKFGARAGLLSGGERQTLAITMVLLNNPKLLLLDEPTAGLSPKTASSMFDYINKLNDFVDIDAICMVEHNLKLALQWATKAIVLVGGHVAYVTDNPEAYLDQRGELEKYYFAE